MFLGVEEVWVVVVWYCEVCGVYEVDIVYCVVCRDLYFCIVYILMLVKLFMVSYGLVFG